MINILNTTTNTTTTITIDAKNHKMDDNHGTLLSLPQCDLERPEEEASGSIGKNSSFGIGKDKRSIKTTAKRADLVLLEFPRSRKEDFEKQILKGNCKVLANGQYASLVTPSSSVKLVAVGTSNALVVWNSDNARSENKNKSQAPSSHIEPGEESPTKRFRLDTAASPTSVACRLIQPGGSGSSFLVGQPRDLDPKELLHFFKKRQVGASIETDNPIVSISTNDLCNLFQAAPSQIWEAMLRIPSVVSKYEDINIDGNEGNEKKETWCLVPEEEILFGQRALIETLCEDDDNLGNDDDDENHHRDGSTKVTIENMAVMVSRRLLPLLLETTASSGDDNDKKDRCLAIARKTVLVSSKSSYSSKTKINLNDFNRPFQPEASRIAFYALRDLFLKHPSYAWSDLSEQWSTRLPLGGEYERITSTTEWIEDKTLSGHGGLVPNQLVFSSSTTDSKMTSSKSKENDFGNPKGVISLVDPQAVLTWKGQ